MYLLTQTVVECQLVLLSPSAPSHADQSINCIACFKKQKLKIKVKPHRTDFTPNQSSLAQNLSSKKKNKKKTPKSKLHTSCLLTSQSPNICRLSTDSPFYTHRF